MKDRAMAQLNFNLEAVSQAARAVPSGAGTAYTFLHIDAQGWQLAISIAVGIATLIYTLAQLAYLVHKWRKKEIFYANATTKPKE